MGPPGQPAGNTPRPAPGPYTPSGPGPYGAHTPFGPRAPEPAHAPAWNNPYATPSGQPGWQAAGGGTPCLVLGVHTAVGGGAGRFRDDGTPLLTNQTAAGDCFTRKAVEEEHYYDTLLTDCGKGHTDQVIGFVTAPAGTAVAKAQENATKLCGDKDESSWAPARGPHPRWPAVHRGFVWRTPRRASLPLPGSGTSRGTSGRGKDTEMESGPAVFAGAVFVLFGAGLLLWTGVRVRQRQPVAYGVAPGVAVACTTGVGMVALLLGGWCFGRL